MKPNTETSSVTSPIWFVDRPRSLEFAIMEYDPSPCRFFLQPMKFYTIWRLSWNRRSRPLLVSRENESCNTLPPWLYSSEPGLYHGKWFNVHLTPILFLWYRFTVTKSCLHLIITKVQYFRWHMWRISSHLHSRFTSTAGVSVQDQRANELTLQGGWAI